MLTVKHVGLTGNEMMISAQRVWFYPASADVPRGCGGTVTIVPAALDAVNEDIHEGKIFVMNEGGKTIDRYDLGAMTAPSSSFVEGAIYIAP